jgi:hypothetical protein
LAQRHRLLHPALLLSAHSAYLRPRLAQLLRRQPLVLLLPQQHLHLAQQQQRLHLVRRQQHLLGVRFQGCRWAKVQLGALLLAAAPSRSQQRVVLALDQWQPRVCSLHPWQHSSRLR